MGCFYHSKISHSLYYADNECNLKSAIDVAKVLSFKGKKVYLADPELEKHLKETGYKYTDLKYLHPLPFVESMRYTAGLWEVHENESYLIFGCCSLPFSTVPPNCVILTSYEKIMNN